MVVFLYDFEKTFGYFVHTSPNFADYLCHATLFTLDKSDTCTRDQQLHVSKLGESLEIDELSFKELNNIFVFDLLNCEGVCETFSKSFFFNSELYFYFVCGSGPKSCAKRSFFAGDSPVCTGGGDETNLFAASQWT